MTQKMTMREFVSPQAVTASLEAATKKEVLQKLAASAASQLGADQLAIFDVLWERERLGSTGVGQGIAIPHGRVPGLDKVHGFFARLARPVVFEAIDDQPVDLVFMLLAPESAGADHLQALAAVSKSLRDASLCEKLRQAKDGAGIYKILAEIVPAAA